MSRGSLSTGQMLVLVGGSALLVAAGLAAGVIISPRPPMMAGGADSGRADDQQAGGDKDGGMDAKKTVKTVGKLAGKKGKAVAKLAGMLPAGALGFANARSTSIAARAGDSASEAVGGVVTPGLNVASGAAQAVLPPFLARQVPWVNSYVNYKVRSSAKTAVEETAHHKVEALSGHGEEGGASESEDETGPAEAGSGAGEMQAQAESEDESSQPGEAAPQPAAAVMAAPSERTDFGIELGRFASRRNAESFSEEMTRRGIGTRIVLEDFAGRSWFSVRVGLYGARAAAEESLGRLRSGGLDGVVVAERSGSGS